MLVVMDQTGDKGGKDVMLLETFANLAICHQEGHTLHGVDDVRRAVVRIVFEVSHGELTSHDDHVLQWDVVQIEEVHLFEDLEGNELE